jgi:two-component system, chemotaxis family, sensor kinase CheA
MDDQVLSEFLAEAEELIESLYSDLKLLRERRNKGKERRELVGRIFRYVHTIKGSSAAAGLESTSHIAHEFESLLDAIRMGRVSVTDDVLVVSDDAVAAIAQSLRSAQGGQGKLPRSLIDRIQRVASGTSEKVVEEVQPPPPAPPAQPESLPDDIVSALSEYEAHKLKESVEEGARLLVITVSFDLMTFDQSFRELSEVLNEKGELISTLPSFDETAPDRICFRLIYVTEEETSQVETLVASYEPKIKEYGNKSDQAEAIVQEESISEAEEEPEDEQPAEAPAQSTIAALTTLVRVNLSELDEMVAATHDLLTDVTGTIDLVLDSELSRSKRTELDMRAARIRRRFLELEERLIELRMVPVEQTLHRAARAGVTAARSTGVDVDIDIQGGDVRLDKSLADAISDPLLHLLRNAVDHGVEPPAERRKVGKNERGSVRLEALSEGSRVIIKVMDDGRGIDGERVRRKAIERGIIEPDAKLTEQETLKLIFRPGFSTAASVSSVSGRGVGLDVVEQTVERYGGELRVRSRPGKGSTFEMVLPTSLALIPSLVVNSAGHRYCIDAGHIIETGHVNLSEIQRIAGAEVIRWRGTLIPFVRLRNLLEQPAVDLQTGTVPVIISRIAGSESQESVDEKGAAVVVDKWEGHRDVLVRGLGRHSTHWRGLSGATEFPDGTVALLLDLPRLLQIASNESRQESVIRTN